MKDEGHTSFMRSASMPHPDVSHSLIIVLLKIGSSRKRVVHISSFKTWKDRGTIVVQLTVFF